MPLRVYKIRLTVWSIMELKDLLGESFKDGMTIDEINTALKNRNFADLSKGEYVSVDKFKKADKEAKEMQAELEKIKLANMSEEEKRQAEIQNIMEELKEAKAQNERNNLEKSILKNGYTPEECEVIMADPSNPQVYASIMAKRIETAVAQTQAKAIKTTTVTPQGNDETKPKKITDYTMQELNDIMSKDPALYKELLKK